MTAPDSVPPASAPPGRSAPAAIAATRRRFWSTKERYRVLGVGVVAAVLLVTIGALALSRLDDIDASLAAAVDEAIPARDALRATEAALRSSQYEFAGLLIEGEAVARTRKVEDIRQTLSEGESAWRDYLDAAVGLPGEAGLQATYADLQERREGLVGPVGFLLVRPEEYDSVDILTSPEFAELREVQEAQREVVATLIAEHYDPLIAEELGSTAASVANGRRDVVWLLVVLTVLGAGGFAVALRSSVLHEAEQTRHAEERARQARRNELEATLQRALGMAADEDRVMVIVEEAIVRSAADLPVEMLLSDAPEAHFSRVLGDGGPYPAPGCPVASPHDCPACGGTETKVFRSSGALDACPHLRDRPGPARSAACIPVTIAGRATGVLHAVADDEHPPAGETLDHLELIGDRLGQRLTMVRAMAERELQARLDPLTGLLNRRSLDGAVGPLAASGRRYVVAFGDLDRFKRLNDTYGHAAGDRALRLFARALRDGLRPSDLACRYGGEEFVVVLPDTTLTEAADVVERVRASLVDLLAAGTTPPFTVSFGLADSTQGDGFDDVIRLADQALLEAKAAGRDRVLLAGDPALSPPQLSDRQDGVVDEV